VSPRFRKQNDGGRDQIFECRIVLTDVVGADSEGREIVEIIEEEIFSVPLDSFPNITQEKLQAMIDQRKAVLLARMATKSRLNLDTIT
jgi:hypothetical protein